MDNISSVPLKDVDITDRFWSRYIKLLKNKVIPYQWEMLNDNIDSKEKSYCIRNFKIAAGLEKGEFKGVVFQDTDVAKWIEASAYTLAYEMDSDLEEKIDYVVDLIDKSQWEDGYINTYYTLKEPDRRWTNLKEGHELYTAGHMIEAAVAYYNATGKKKFLNIVCKFADLICEVFKEHEGYPGHQEIELALIKLYKVTRKKEYLEQAKKFIDNRGKSPNYFFIEEKKKEYKQIFKEFDNYLSLYSQSHKPVREQETAEGHAVRAVYMYSAMADLAYIYNDKELMDTCKTLWENITKKRMFITGSIGSSGILERFTCDYDLPNDINYSETCATVGLILFSRRMAKITKEAKYIDVLEIAMYNTLLSGIALDGQSFFYVNPLEVWPDNCLDRTSREHVKPERQKWFGVACCPPNIARTLGSLGENVYFHDDNNIWINLFISNKTKIRMPNSNVNLSIDTNYPNNGLIKIHITSEKEMKNLLKIRIPEHTDSFSVKLDGLKTNDFKIKKGYLVINNIYKDNNIELNFDMKPKFIHTNPEVRQNTGKIALKKGPLVYCFEETDNFNNLSSIFIKTSQKIEEYFEKDLLGGVTTLKLSGKKIIKKNWVDEKLYKETNLELQNVSLKAVPYYSWGNREKGEMIVWIKEFIS